jgi:hypothetical protein
METASVRARVVAREVYEITDASRAAFAAIQEAAK